MIVLDCSAAVEIARGTLIGKSLSNLLSDADLVMAPDLLYAELASACRKYSLAGFCSAHEAADVARACADLVDFFAPAREFYIEAIAESVRLSHSSYDFFYLLLAKRNSALLLTRDAALGRLCDQEGVRSEGWR